MDQYATLDVGGRQVAVRKDLRVPMRDGVTLVADAYHGTDSQVTGDRPRPALVALSPYGKELQALALTMPPQRRPSPLWDGCIEAGDIARVVDEGYVHVIGDLRGSGGSGGEHIGNYNAGGIPLGQDAYDFIEWVAAQPWCDGNVGMIGISYYGSMQVIAAAERPPHLKAIFVSGGHYDFYETTYHGGVMWFMPRAAREGRVAAIDGRGRLLESAPFRFAPGAKETRATIALPLELRNDSARIAVQGVESAGSVQLVDARYRRRPVGLVSGSANTEQPLLSDLFYIERALEPYAEIRRGTLAQVVDSGIAVLVLADVGQLTEAEHQQVAKFVEEGGLLAEYRLVDPPGLVYRVGVREGRLLLELVRDEQPPWITIAR